MPPLIFPFSFFGSSYGEVLFWAMIADFLIQEATSEEEYAHLSLDM